MSGNNIICLKQITNFLQIPINKIALNNDKLPTCNIKDKSVTGFINIIFSLLKQNESPLLSTDAAELAEIRQWLEYCVIYASRCNNPQSTNQVLQELNSILATRTYFVGNKLTIADVALFYALRDMIENCNYLEKEKYLNVSRWFDNIQQIDSIRNDKPLIDFSTIFLSCVSLR